MTGWRLLSRHVVFTFLSLGLTAGQPVQRLGICAGTSHTFGLSTFGCQEHYSLMNLTLQRRHSPCNNSTILHSGAEDEGEECYNHYMKVVFKGITNSVSRCQFYCENDFQYPLYARISHVSGCCEGIEPPCSFDQMWLYYVCDLRRVTEPTPHSTEGKHPTWTSPDNITTEGPQKGFTDITEPRRNSCYGREEKYNHEHDPVIFGTLCAVIGVLSLAVILLLFVNSRLRRKLPRTIPCNHTDLPMHSLAADAKRISHCPGTDQTDLNSIGLKHNSVVGVIEFAKSSFSDISIGSLSLNNFEDAHCSETQIPANHVDNPCHSDRSNTVSCASEVRDNTYSELDNNQTKESTHF